MRAQRAFRTGALSASAIVRRPVAIDGREWLYDPTATLGKVFGRMVHATRQIVQHLVPDDQAVAHATFPKHDVSIVVDPEPVDPLAVGHERIRARNDEPSDPTERPSRSATRFDLGPPSTVNRRRPERHGSIRQRCGGQSICTRTQKSESNYKNRAMQHAKTKMLLGVVAWGRLTRELVGMKR